MANQNQNGGRSATLPPENQPAWSPQERAQPLTHHAWRDRNYLDEDRSASERDPRRWEGGRGSEVGYVDYGDRSSGQAAQRYGDVRWQHALQRSEQDAPPGRADARADGRLTTERMGSQGGSNARAEPMGYQGTSSGRSYVGYRLARGAGPHRGKGPLGYRRSDERILELVCEVLADDDQLDASQVMVTVNGGEVTLAGIVEDRYAKRDAEQCAGSIMGVRDVRNLLRLKGDPPPLKTSPGRPPPPPGKTEPHDKKPRV